MARPQRYAKGTSPRIVPGPDGQSGRDWQDRYRMAVWRWFIEHGSAEPAPDGPEGPWDDGIARDAESLREHMAGCAPDPDRSTLAEDTSWSIWGGTFGEDSVMIGMKVTVTCRCGKVRGRSWHLETTDMAALINGLTS